MAYPTIAVKVSFGTNRYDTPSYTTLTSSDIKGLDVEHGRHSELDGSDPGTLGVTLFNDTRTYDPRNTSGTYYPNLTPGKKTQVTATYAGVTYELFNGWTTGWPNTYQTRIGTAILKASGPFMFLQRATVPDPYQAAVLADSPVAYYRLGDAEAHTIVDSSGNELHGHWWPDYFDLNTTDGLVVSDDKAVKLKGQPAVQIGKLPAAVIPALRPMSIEFWIEMDKLPQELTEGLYLGNEVFSTVVGPTGGPNVRVWSETGSYPGAIDFLVVDSPDPTAWHIAEATSVHSGFGAPLWWAPLQANGKVHIVCTINAAGDDMFIWFNTYDATGTLDFTGTVTATPAWDLISLNWAAGWDGDCIIDELAFYGVELNSTQVYDHWAAGAVPGLDDATGERIDRVLDLIGWPASLRDLDTGQTSLGIAKDMAGKKALDYLDIVTATEQGVLTEAHDDSGKLRFQGRAQRLTDSRSATVQTLFSDDATDIASNSAVVYSEIDLATDDRPAANKVTVKWRGGDIVDIDDASVDAYGEIPVTVETLLESVDAATSLADWILAEQSALFTRVRSVTIRPNAQTGTQADRAWVACLSTKVGDRKRVVHKPVSTGTAIDQHLYVIGVEHHAANGVEEWETTLHFSPAITTTYWILGTAQLGTGTTLAY
jgi:hypothetical protein